MMKTCRTCKHHYRDVFYKADWCSAPTQEDRMIGREKGMQWCTNARGTAPWSECGPDGKLWEGKQPTLPPSQIRLESGGWNFFNWLRNLCR